LTHAPQAPYFMGPPQYPNGAYLTINQQVGNLIDYYNVQFYNQGTSTYDSYTTLFTTSNGWSTLTSVQEMINKGIPASKILIGKPPTPGDVDNTGLVTAANLASWITTACQNGIVVGGAMTWQYPDDISGSFMNPVASAFNACTVKANQ